MAQPSLHEQRPGENGIYFTHEGSTSFIPWVIGAVWSNLTKPLLKRIEESKQRVAAQNDISGQPPSQGRI